MFTGIVAAVGKISSVTPLEGGPDAGMVLYNRGHSEERCSAPSTAGREARIWNVHPFRDRQRRSPTDRVW